MYKHRILKTFLAITLFLALAGPWQNAFAIKDDEEFQKEKIAAGDSLESNMDMRIERYYRPPTREATKLSIRKEPDHTIVKSEDAVGTIKYRAFKNTSITGPSVPSNRSISREEKNNLDNSPHFVWTVVKKPTQSTPTKKPEPKTAWQSIESKHAIERHRSAGMGNRPDSKSKSRGARYKWTDESNGKKKAKGWSDAEKTEWADTNAGN